MTGRRLNPEQIPQLVHELLESFFWLPGLEANKRYARLHDDHDGKCDGHIAVLIGEDGDAWVDPLEPDSNGLRFRMPLHGGGSSPRVRTALVILAEAIRLDNETNPLQSAAEYHKQRGSHDVRADFLAAVRWICGACNTVNAIDAQACEGCKKPKPEVKST